MSIEGLIQDCLEARQLFPLLPWLPSVKPVRVIYISREVKDFIDSPEDRAGQLHADLDSFIGGHIITVSTIPHKARNAYMGLLDPSKDGIWDIRSRDPSPSLRLLGGFSGKDEFVGLALHRRALMGAGNSKEWAIAITHCKSEWRKRFHAYKPLTGDSLHDCLSNYSRVD